MSNNTGTKQFYQKKLYIRFKLESFSNESLISPFLFPGEMVLFTNKQDLNHSNYQMKAKVVWLPNWQGFLKTEYDISSIRGGEHTKKYTGIEHKYLSAMFKLHFYSL